MKKIIGTILLAVSLVAAAPLFAQENAENTENTEGSKEKAEYYYVHKSIEKIWPYRKGYIVQYRKGMNQFARTYIPSEWFTNAASRGEILTLPKGMAWPTMTVFYKNGEFSHVRLYVHPWRSHQTWGNVPQNVNIDGNFEDLEDVRVEF